MSNEITYNFQTVLKNGTLQDQYASGPLAASQVSALLIRNVANITIAAGGEALALGDVATPGIAIFSNLDITNYVEIGSFVGGTFYPFLKLGAGEQVMAKLSVVPYARANTATVNLFYAIYSA